MNMTKAEFTDLATKIVAVVALLLVAFGVLRPDEAPVVEINGSDLNLPEARGVTNFDSLTLSNDLVVGDDASIAGETTLAGATTQTGNLTASADLIVDDVFNTDENAYALTGAQTLNPTATYYQMAPTATLTLTLGTTGVAAGDYLIVNNTVVTSTVIVDTGATLGDGDIVLGLDDIAGFVYDGTAWVETTAPSNNGYWTIHVPGTLAANVNVRFTVPHSGRVTHVSAVASNNSDATMTLGISSDTDSILASTTIGDSNTPATFTRANWAAANPTGALAAGNIVVLTVDYDGGSGTAAADLTVVITTVED